MKVLLFDVEATALRDGQICQFTWLLLDNIRRFPGNFFFSVDQMTPGAQEVHGLTPASLERLSCGQRFPDRAVEIQDLLASADLLAGHNVSADLRFLKTEFDRLRLELPSVAAFCTMNYFTPITRLKRVYHTNRFKPPKLSELTDHYSITSDVIAQDARRLFGAGDVPHDARFDVAAVYLALRAAAQNGDLPESLSFFA